MKKKPDILWVLTLVFTLGVVTTDYTQGWLVKHAQAEPTEHPPLAGAY